LGQILNLRMTSILGRWEYFFFVRILTQLKYLSKLTPVPAESENSQNPHFFYPSFPVYTILTCDSWRRGYCSLLYLYGLCLFNCLFSLSILLSNGGMISTVPFLLMGKILIILSSHSSNVVCQHEKPSWLLLLYQFTLSCSLLGYGYSSLALWLLLSRSID